MLTCTSVFSFKGRSLEMHGPTYEVFPISFHFWCLWQIWHAFALQLGICFLVFCSSAMHAEWNGSLSLFVLSSLSTWIFTSSHWIMSLDYLANYIRADHFSQVVPPLHIETWSQAAWMIYLTNRKRIRYVHFPIFSFPNVFMFKLIILNCRVMMNDVPWRIDCGIALYNTCW